MANQKRREEEIKNKKEKEVEVENWEEKREENKSLHCYVYYAKHAS